MKPSIKRPEQQAKEIESKRSVLAYLRSGPQHLTIESYLCLTQILSQGGWHHDNGHWTKNGQCLPTIEAAIMELDRQVASDRDRLLRQTVQYYTSECATDQITARHASK